MSEPKTRCIECGVSILVCTADNHIGMCRPCYYKAASTPVESFELPVDLVRRLLSMGLDPVDYRKMAWCDGAESVHRYLDRIVECDELRETWFPKLRRFSAACRAADPPASDSPKDRAKREIYGSKIRNAARLPPELVDGKALICRLPREGMSTARRLWPARHPLSVFLTQDELREWQDLYKHPGNAFAWFVKYWWEIQDPPIKDGLWGRLHGDWKVPDGKSAWLVVSGLSWGPLAGGARHELWSWDGENAEFVGPAARWVF